MNIENLEIGKIYKNYKDLCDTLGIESKAGNAKLATLKELQRYVNYHKDGVKFIIDEIYNESKPKLEKLDSTIYGKQVDSLVLDLLAKQLKIGERTIIIGKQKLFKEFQMCNGNYFYGLMNKQAFSKILEIEEIYIDDFYNISYSKLKGTLISSFKRLSSKSLLTWKEVIVIHNPYKEIANDFLERLITSMEVMVMNELKCKNRGEVVLKKLWDVFSTAVNTKIINQEYKHIPEFKDFEGIEGFKFYYRAFKLNFNDFIIDELLEINEYLLKFDERKETKNILNEKLVVNYKKSNQKRYNKNRKECEQQWGEITSKSMLLKTDENYVKNSDLLVDKCINIKI